MEKKYRRFHGVNGFLEFDNDGVLKTTKSQQKGISLNFEQKPDRP